ncbi:hypothetical protein PU99_24305 [Pseudomonas putida]|nr:hypothetical protein PU99_24305 [Pseudomonas putida]
MKLVGVPIQSPAVPIEVIVIGDSIGNREGDTDQAVLRDSGIECDAHRDHSWLCSENDPYDATRSKVMTATEKKRAIFCAYILGRSRKSKKEIQMGGFDLCDQVVQ